MQSDFAIAMPEPNNFGHMAGPKPKKLTTKSIDERMARHVSSFFRRMLMFHFPDHSKDNGIGQSLAEEHIGISQSSISAILSGAKRPGLNFILRLSELTGASFEEITGHRPPANPRYRLPELTTDLDLAEDATNKAANILGGDDERASAIKQKVVPAGPPRGPVED